MIGKPFSCPLFGEAISRFFTYEVRLLATPTLSGFLSFPLPSTPALVSTPADNALCSYRHEAGM
jgi:hypothetical protein